MIGFPLSVPVDGYRPRRADISQVGDVIGGRGQTFLVIELQTEAEVTAVTDWIGRRLPPMPYGGPV
ncbi:MAG: hypothetical protein ACOH2H_16035 [Cypionkella sp.]